VTALIRSEIWRLMSRRFFRVMLAAVVGLAVVVGLIVFVRAAREGSSPPYTTAVPLAMLIAGQPVFALSVLVGASFVGAEWTSGAMTTLLTWEPRRGRILAAKVVAASVVTAIATLAVLLIVAEVLLPSGLTVGTTVGYSGQWLRSVSGLWLRTGAISAIGAALGVGLGTLMRNSAGSIALWLVFEFIASPLLVVWRPRLGLWMPGTNVQQFLRSDQVIGVFDVRQAPGFSTLRSGIVLAAYAACLVGAGFVAFRTRDVT
jgi:ABC-type transport system involved in multi-copper enzyme maturation permease subunit